MTANVSSGSEVPPTSILRATLQAIARCWKDVAPFVLLFLLIEAFFIPFTPAPDAPELSPVTKMCAEQEDAVACHVQNKEAIDAELFAKAKRQIESLPTLLVLYLFRMLMSLVFVYLVSVAYLRRVMKTPPPYALESFWRYAKAIIWKISRPSLWLLIPIVGIIPYFRSFYRYELVGPLALLGDREPLKTSWKMTEGCVWRLLGIYALLGAAGSLLAVALVLLSGGDLSEFGNYVSPHKEMSLGDYFYAALAQIAPLCLTVISALVPFGAYRVLREKEVARQP